LYPDGVSVIEGYQTFFFLFFSFPFQNKKKEMSSISKHHPKGAIAKTTTTKVAQKKKKQRESQVKRSTGQTPFI
jgi:hypothetical protein